MAHQALHLRRTRGPGCLRTSFSFQREGQNEEPRPLILDPALGSLGNGSGGPTHYAEALVTLISDLSFSKPIVWEVTLDVLLRRK